MLIMPLCDCRHRQLHVPAVLALSLWFAVKTMSRNMDWSDTTSLHTADLATNPDSLKLLHSRSVFMSNQAQASLADLDTALAYATRAQDLVNREPSFDFNAG